jgi:hypothetical protein
MADPTVITAVVGTIAAVIGASTPIIIERRHDRATEHDRETDAAEETEATRVASWAGLNEALGREIERLQQDVARIRSDYEAALARQRDEYEAKLAASTSRITELETDVASLRRLLGQPPKP